MATLAIFVFHYLGLLGLYQHRLSLWALLTFSFLSGYLAQSRGVARTAWVVRRYFSVMIPHWLVIGPVLVANWLVGYKVVSPLTALATFLGGNLFLQNPLYVITWYVTFVLLLYAYLLVDSFLYGWARLALTAAGFLFFGTWLGCRDYFIAFSAGLYLSALAPPAVELARRPWLRSVARQLFRTQQLCYPFFLVHGGIQLAVLRLTSVGPLALLVTAFLMSVAAAIGIERTSAPLLRLATDALTRKRVAAFGPPQYGAAQT